MEKVMVNFPFSEEEIKRLKEIGADDEFYFADCHSTKPTDEITEEMLSEATVLMGAFSIPQVSAAKKLHWFQSSASGINNFLGDGIVRKGALLTSSSGAYGQTVSEHGFALLLAIMKHFPDYAVLQKEHKWTDLGEARTLRNAKVLVIGTGDIGSSFAKACKALGAYTIGLRRNAGKGVEGIDEMHAMDELKTLLPASDVVFISIPLDDTTTGLIGYDEIKLMKKDAILINMSRGKHVDNEGLLKALNEGWLWGAGLDVTDPEPLPADNALWDAPRTFITPHAAGGYHLPDTVRKIAAIMIENYRRYKAGEELRNRFL